MGLIKQHEKRWQRDRRYRRRVKQVLFWIAVPILAYAVARVIVLAGQLVG